MRLSHVLGRRAAELLRSLAGKGGAPAGSAVPLPYPVAIRRREGASEAVPPGGGTESFDTPEALAINQARMSHLASLGLPLDGRAVLDVGCGVGHLADYFLSHGCSVTCVDAREQNLASLRARSPRLHFRRLDVEVESLSQLGPFPVVFAYGLLYHLENPLAALRNMASVCLELLLLETMVCDDPLPVMRVEPESGAFNQALRGLGCRPSPAFVVLALERSGFPHVYAPRVLPAHQDFRFEWKGNQDWWRDAHPLRCIFVGSKIPLHNPNLVDLIRD